MDEKKFLDLSKYELLNKIGKGAFSKVFCVKETFTGKMYAAKVLHCELNEKTIGSEEMVLLLREINLMASLNHPSILGFVGFSLYNFRQKPFPTIITNLAKNGTLREIITLEISGLSPKGWDYTRKLINIYGIASGLSYLHMNKIIHRDMKPENVLMDEYLFPKIADFGLSKSTEVISQSMNMQSQVGPKGTPIYMAPEIFRCEPYTSSVDVYSFAIIVYEILTGIKPFTNLQYTQLMFNVVYKNLRPELTSDIPMPFQNLISQCWSANPEERPTFDEIVNRLKTDKDFITDSVNEDEYYDYIDYIDNYKSSYDVSHYIHLRDMKNNSNVKISEQEVSQKVVEQEVTQGDDLSLLYKKMVFEDKTQKKIEKAEKPRNKSENIYNLHTFVYMISTGLENVFVDSVFEEEEDEDEEFLDFLNNQDNMRFVKAISKETNEIVLCKIVKPDFLKTDYEYSSYDQKTRQFSIIKEAYTAKELDCPSIVKFYGIDLYNPYMQFSMYDEDEDDEPVFVSITFFYECPKNRTLRNVINDHIQLTPAQRQIIIIGIAHGLYYLSQKGVNHGCLGPEAIWLDENFYPKIYMVNPVMYDKGSFLRYQAPELLGKSEVVSIESDVFSFGRLLYYLITGSEPFKHAEDESRNCKSSYTLMARINSGINPLIPDCVSDPLRELLQKCWDTHIYDRPSAEELYYEIIKSDKLQVSGIDEEGKIQVKRFIDKLAEFQSSMPKFKLSIECTDEATVDEFDVFECIDELIHSKFMLGNEKDNLALLNKAADCEYFQEDEKLLQKVIAYVNKLSSEGNEDAKEFLRIVFGDPITDISDSSLTKITSLNISDTHESIPKRTFRNFCSLVRVNIPNSVTKIGYGAFSNCSNLTFVNIPESIEGESISKRAFKNCPKLKCIKMPYRLTKIDAKTFKGDKNLSNVEMNNRLRIIGREAFANCKSIQYLKIPKSVEKICDKAFYGCQNLKVIIFEGKKPILGNDVMSSDVSVIYEKK